MRVLLLTAGLLVSGALCAGPEAQCPVRTVQKTDAFEVGFNIETFLPNRLPDFNVTLPVYGPLLAIPLFGNLIQLQAYYGALAGLSLYTVEANYRFNIPMPSFTAFLLAGGHYLQYYFMSKSNVYRGPNFGTGVSFDMTDGFDMNLIMKVYVQEKALFTFGGGFSFLL